MATQPPTIACDLGPLSPAERERRATLARTLVGRASSIQELADGYALEFPATAELAQESLEWLLFERRFAAIEDALAAQGKTPADASLDEMDALWDAAKAAEKKSG